MNTQKTINTHWIAGSYRVVITHIHEAGEHKGLVTCKLVKADKSLSKHSELHNPDKLKPITNEKTTIL